MMTALLLLPGLVYFTLSSALQGPVVIDRIAVVAGKHPIKTSDIDREVRLTEFLNREPLSLTPERKKKTAERLIDQAIMRNEIATGSYRRASDSEASALVEQIRKDRFGGSDAQLRRALSQYGLTEEELLAQFVWQLTVLRFIDQRFRPGVLVTDEEVRAYYEKHQSELARQYPRVHTFEALEPEIRNTLTAQKVDAEFDEWLDGARKREHIEYLQKDLE
ncbi:MAG TPA: hypothetical protein VG273_20515 [Bryobacteraceae bacterium]|jgi:parvulin-like peptidyl-prolyl isomerase|nr:hypothetical protein [Bryobacteraceae bacterium]